MKKIKMPLVTLLFAVLIFCVTYFTNTEINSAYVSLGDALVMLAACFLPTSYAMLAAGIGNAAASCLIGGPVMILYTTIIRMLVACWFMDIGNRILDARNFSGAGIGAILLIAGPFLVDLLRFSTFGNVREVIIAAVVNVILFFVLAFICDTLKLRSRIFPAEQKNK